MNTSATYKQKARDEQTLILIANYGTDAQRALWRALNDRLDHQANAVAKARQKHPEAPLVWLAADGTVTPVIP